MRKTFKLDELDCANCGAKIEAEIKQIIDEALKAAHKYEPDCDIVR